MFYFYNTPNGISYGQLASCTARATNKIYLIDPKHLKQSREDGPYCTISGNEPSSVTLSKTTMVSKIDVVREFFVPLYLNSIIPVIHQKLQDNLKTNKLSCQRQIDIPNKPGMTEFKQMCQIHV